MSDPKDMLEAVEDGIDEADGKDMSEKAKAERRRKRAERDKSVVNAIRGVTRKRQLEEAEK